MIAPLRRSLIHGSPICIRNLPRPGLVGINWLGDNGMDGHPSTEGMAVRQLRTVFFIET